MKYQVYFSFPFFFLLLLLGSCSDSSDDGLVDTPEDVFEAEDPAPVSDLVIGSNEIICKFCDGFGSFIETYEDQIIVGGSQNVWIFQRNAQTIILIQEIDVGESLWLNSISVVDDLLMFGLHDAVGTGSVHQYTQNASNWEFKLSYEIGRSQDNFGNDIDFSDAFLAIGASAVWSNTVNTGNTDAGSFYIYSKNGSEWNLTDEFFAENSFADDRFGSDVIIWENFILAGGLSIPLHIYTFDNQVWSLLRVEENIRTADIDHYENTILYYSEEFGFQSFRMNADASFDTLKVDPGLDLSAGIRFSGDNISMTDGFALTLTLGAQEINLLKLTDNEWAVERTFSPGGQPQFEYSGVKLTPELALIGGNDNANATFYLFLENY